MNRFLQFLQRLALTFWLGEMLFFIVIFAPRVFKVLERPDAAKLQASIFPAYYTAGVACGVLFIATSFLIMLRESDRRRLYPKLILPLACAALAVFAVSLWWITPSISELQPLILAENVDPAAREQFDFLHGLSVKLNGGALLALLAILLML